MTFVIGLFTGWELTRDAPSGSTSSQLTVLFYLAAYRKDVSVT